MYKNILIPVLLDGDGHQTQASYAVARALAADGAKFTVMHVVEEIPGFISVEIPDEVIDKVADAAKTALAQSAAALPGAATHLTRGHAGTAITNYANDHHVDCIVIASHKPGIEDFFLGSTASRVVRHAKCSVHVIR